MSKCKIFRSYILAYKTYLYTVTIRFTNMLGTYFFVAGLGKIAVGAEDIFVISTASPIGQLLVGKTVGEEIVFNGVSQRILAVG